MRDLAQICGILVIVLTYGLLNNFRKTTIQAAARIAKPPAAYSYKFVHSRRTPIYIL